MECPKCKVTEMHPTEDMLLIRAYKVDHYSQCLVCSGYYDKDLNLTPELHNPKKGWFK